MDHLAESLSTARTNNQPFSIRVFAHSEREQASDFVRSFTDRNCLVEIVRSSGARIDPAETLVVATTDSFGARARRGARATVTATAPLIRDAVAGWLTARGGRLRAADLSEPPRWQPLDGAAYLAAG